MNENYEINEEVMVDEYDEGGSKNLGTAVGIAVIAGGAIAAERLITKGVKLGKDFWGRVQEAKKAKQAEGQIEEVEVVEETTDSEK